MTNDNPLLAGRVNTIKGISLPTTIVTKLYDFHYRESLGGFIVFGIYFRGNGKGALEYISLTLGLDGVE